MPGKAAKVVVTERQWEILDRLSRSKSEPTFIQQRASIVLLAWGKMSNQDISTQVKLECQAVGTWRRRWRDTWEDLTLWECSEPRRLCAAICETLRDAPRSGSPGRVTAEQVTQILAVACEPPQKSGRPITHWTHRELRDEVVKRQIVSKISVSQVGRYLRQALRQPHRRKMWLNTTEKDPAKFQQQVENVCETLSKGPASARQERHTHGLRG